MATTCGKVISSRPLVAARDAEAARLHPAEWHARIGGGHDEIIDQDEARIDLRRERTRSFDIAGEDGGAERELAFVRRAARRRPRHGRVR